MPDRLMDSAVLDRPAQRWDYSVVSIHARSDQALEERLRELGRDGWELVALETPMANDYHCVFKRRD